MNQNEVLIKESILTEQSFLSKEEATTMSGEILLKNGYVEKEYIDSMLEKLETQSFATYIGNGVAIPHGMAEGSQYVNHTGISVIRFLKEFFGMRKWLMSLLV
jgi:mannitol/fructose-specific phosphotransferase system IIA component